MNKKTLAIVAVIVSVTAVGVILPRTLAQAGQGPDLSHKSMVKMKPPAKTEVLRLEIIHAQHIPWVITSIEKARKAIVTGDKETALIEMKKAREMLLVIHRSLGTYVKPKFANDRCPIMGTPINPDKVIKSLIRDYNGEKVAFCCAGCPAAWDKLSDAQKQAKLVKVKP